MSILSIAILLLLASQVNGCQDLVPCGKAIGYCNMPHLIKTMSVNCPLTCGFCQPYSPPAQPQPQPQIPSSGGNNGNIPINPNPAYPYPNPPSGNNPPNPYPYPYPYPNPYPNPPSPPAGNNPPINPNPSLPTGPPVFKFPKYKLHYFNIRYKAEPIRMMFHYKSVPFKDIRIKKSEWATRKSSYPDDVPMLEMDLGEVGCTSQRAIGCITKLSQSMAIYHFLGRKLGLFGANELENAYLDYIAEIWREFIEKTLTYKRVAAKVQSGDENDLHDNQFMPAIQKYAPKMEQFLDRSASGFFGGSVSWVDFYVAGTIQTFMYIDPVTVMSYTKLADHNDRIYKLPELQAYLKKHPPVSVL